MKIWLPLNLLTHLEGTGIAECFGLKFEEAKRQTLIEVSAQEGADLLALLTALGDELEQRDKRFQRRNTRTPLGGARRAETGRQIAAIRDAVSALAPHVAKRNTPRQAVDGMKP